MPAGGDSLPCNSRNKLESPTHDGSTSEFVLPNCFGKVQLLAGFLCDFFFFYEEHFSLRIQHSDSSGTRLVLALYPSKLTMPKNHRLMTEFISLTKV